MLDAGRNYVILAAALLVLAASLKLFDDSNKHRGSLSMIGSAVERCQSSGFELGTKRVGCRTSGAAFGR